MTIRPIDPTLMRVDAHGIRLIGSRCGACAEIDFPAQDSCRRCGATDMRVAHLGERGVLWSWTVQRFPPPSPPYVPRGREFEAFGVGYVELPGEVIIESLLTESDADRLWIGMPMRLTTFDVPGHCGEQATTFAFAPVTEGAGQ
ncbi:Zn-ribbon domain-containing OB-fold protein [Nocardia acidivorans]|uniref:Zn-ribbon domain-containing OB-fold protein n=1 Tax=Nocardia acidivorans TaxID=404580 RepID=UPI00082BC057|nr:OB-fold domain-containing protein [Nocardia acidivorans]